jgi:hypothetical protein
MADTIVRARYCPDMEEIQLLREITTHKVSGLNESIAIHVLDSPSIGGASHHYLIGSVLNPIKSGKISPVDIHFQLGPILKVGINGVSNESLLAVVIDRLQSFQRGDFACRANDMALVKLEEAMHWLHARTRGRMNRGVEGTLEK